MRKYSYAPPKLKDSTKIIEVIDEKGNVVCKFKRTYNNFIAKFAAYLWSFDWNAQVDVYSIDGKRVYQCKKTTKWVGAPYYQVLNFKTNETFQRKKK